MPPTGFHGLLGLLLASGLNQKHHRLRIGIVTGSVIPDLDLIGSIILFLFTSNLEISVNFHRSITHSLTIMFLIFGLTSVTSFFSQSARNFLPYIIGGLIGALIHVILDLFYFDGVSLFWPLQPFGIRNNIIPFTYIDLPSIYNSLLTKIISILDGFFEIIFYLSFAFLANRYTTNQELNLSWCSNKVTIHHWPKKLVKFSYFLIIEMIFFIGLAFISISWPLMNRDNFIILLYIPLIPIILLSGILPLLMCDTIISLGKKTV
ncbi:MAG: metal-dependent hydrolase [Candidatus Hodarchaeales archaeon]|jgi:membrane-bound metal-dependent hydrolase YbcI (DUF457 family)